MSSRRPARSGSGGQLAVTPLLLMVLALLTAVGPLAVDMYTPGFPVIATELEAAQTSVQLTLTTFLVGLGFGQLVIGPLSDRWGRRPLLVGGAAVCALASAACALAPSVEALIGFRLVQGLGGAAGIVLSRAVISDLAHGAAAAQAFSVLAVFTGIAPVVAPLGGGALIGPVGWRGIFWVITAIAVVMLVAVVLLVPETHRKSAGARLPRGHLSRLANGALPDRPTLRNRRYVWNVVTLWFAFAVLFGYISGSPFVLQNVYGLSPQQFALLFGLSAGAMAALSLLNAALVKRFPARRLLLVGVVALAAASGSVLLLGALTTHNISYYIALAAVSAALGLVFPNATALALEAAPAQVGAASAVLGAGQFTFAAIATPLVGVTGTVTASSMGLVMAIAAATAAVTATVAR